MVIELRAGQAKAIVLPEYGARLHQLFVPFEGRSEPVLYAPDHIAAYRERPTRGGAFPMAPWPNRIAGSRFEWRGQEYAVPDGGKPNAIHGRVLDKEWKIERFDEPAVELSCPFDEGWPWRGSAWQRFELTENSLTMRLEVRAEDQPFPAGCGWHPWFQRNAFGANEVRVGLDAGRRYELKGHLPTGGVITPSGEYDLSGGQMLGDRRLDDCFSELAGPVIADWGVMRLTVSIDSPVPHVQVYTPPEAFCIEPQTCAPDAFNMLQRGVPETGFAVAEPGRPVSIVSRWTWMAETD